MANQPASIHFGMPTAFASDCPAMSELTEIRLIAFGGLLAILACWLVARAYVRRRRSRFLAVADALGNPGEVVNEFLYRFHTILGERPFEVRCQHLGGGGLHGTNSGPADWCLVASTRLAGVADVHAADVRPRSRRRLRQTPIDADAFVVRDFGSPLPQGWLDQRVATALRDFYPQTVPLDSLSIEEGRLVYRSRRLLGRIRADDLRAFLARLDAVAGSIESTLKKATMTAFR